MLNNWYKYISHIYNICNYSENQENINELTRVNIYNLNNFSFIYYNSNNLWKDCKHFKKAAFINVIEDAYNNHYDNILIIYDECYFYDIQDSTLESIIKNDITIINPGDICEDCIVLSTKVIEYIYNLHLNRAKNNWVSTLKDAISKLFKPNKTNLQICKHKIDYIVTYVNGTDPAWQKEYLKYKESNPATFNKANRWKDWGTFLYHLIGITKFMPWINNVYIVLSQESQKEPYMELISNNIKIVYHNEIIPNTLLPTYNSCTIEMFLHNIEGLSEYYIYANDDTYTIGNILEKDYFYNGLPKNIYVDITKLDTNYLKTCINNFNKVISEFSDEELLNLNVNKNVPKRLNHLPHAFLKSTSKHIYNLYNQDIINNSTRFRKDNNYNLYLYALYDNITEGQNKLSIIFKYLRLSNLTDTPFKPLLQNKIICLNDNISVDSQNIRIALQRFFLMIPDFKILYDKIIIKSNKLKLNKNLNEKSQINYSVSKQQSNEINISKTITLPIDIVIPYVDFNDIEWKTLYYKYLNAKIDDTNIYNDNISKTQWDNWAIGEERFRSNDLLKYVFRSIEKNALFINNVYLIVMLSSLIPSWINTNNVKTIFHEEFIPLEFLPTFNSSTIEMFLHEIPNLSNYFIYGNDDMFFTSNNNINDFFKNGLPVYGVKTRTRRLNWVGDILRYEDKKLLKGILIKDNTVDEVLHIWTPYIKNNIKECFNLYKNTIYSNSTRFREKNNYNQWLFSLYLYYNKNTINKQLNYFHTEIVPRRRIKYSVNWEKYKAICLNDSLDTTEKDLSIIKNKLEKMFPNKSKYEI